MQRKIGRTKDGAESCSKQRESQNRRADLEQSKTRMKCLDEIANRTWRYQFELGESAVQANMYVVNWAARTDRSARVQKHPHVIDLAPPGVTVDSFLRRAK